MQRDRLPIEPLDRLAVDLLEQVILIAGYVVDEVKVESFLIGP